MADPADLAKQLAALQASYVEQLPGKLEGLRDSLHALLHGSWDPETIRTAHRQAHSLTGSGATFGFEPLSHAARILEQQLKIAVSSATLPDDAWSYNAANALDVLARVVHDVVASVVAPAPAVMDSATVSPSPAAPNLVYVVEDDELLANEWSAQLQHYGFAVRRFGSLAEFDKAMRSQPPAAVLMDQNLLDGSSGNHLLFRPAHARVTAPVILVSGSGDFETRLAAVRAGAAAFLTKPLDMAALTDRLSALLYPENNDPYRIVIVDDSEEIGVYHATLLRAAGLQVDVVADPLALMQHIGTTVPDLLLLDVYMPGCSGLELAAVLRQQDAYAGIPIVFLSSETDVGRQLAALDIGGDDFLAKPVSPERLVAAVQARVKRARAMRALMSHDGLTGLLNHLSSKDAIEREGLLARRQQRAFCVALIDVDHFKKVNDQHGHPVGDRVLKSLARLLSQRLRRSDVIGRYGGEEFIVALPDTDPETGFQVLNRIREAFSDIEHRVGETGFKVTFSAGLAGQRPNTDNVIALIAEADRALYAAKAAGRNRILLAAAD